MIVSGLVEARVSINRLSKFLMNEELDPKAVSHTEDPEYPILIKGNNRSMKVKLYIFDQRKSQTCFGYSSFLFFLFDFR